jgi:hypothetical protein
MKFSPKKLFIVCQNFRDESRVLSLNPQLKAGVEIGMVLKVPSQLPLQEDRKEYTALSKKSVW